MDITQATDGRPESFFELLKEKAYELAIDYPWNENTDDAFDWLHALTSSFSGTIAANKDCHKVIKKLQVLAKVSDEELLTLWPQTNELVR